MCSAGAQIVLGWCSNCARLVLRLCSAGAQIVLGWCSAGAQIVLSWCSNCARLVLKLCSAGAQIVLGWCLNCAFLVVPLVRVLSSLWTFPCPDFFFLFYAAIFAVSLCFFWCFFWCFFLCFFLCFFVLCFVLFWCFFFLLFCALFVSACAGFGGWYLYAPMKFCDLGFGWAQGLGARTALRLQERCHFPTWPIWLHASAHYGTLCQLHQAALLSQYVLVLATMQTPCPHLLRVTRECIVYSL